ncbi:MAG: lactonase family protein [Candidatus Cryptobacteroides sp.]
MKTRTLISTLLAAAAISSCKCSGELKLLVGTYTTDDSGPGVYYYSFNPETCEATLIDTARAGNPSFVIPAGDRRHAYSVGEYDDGRQKAITYTLTDSKIDPFNEHSADGSASGAAPCNIIVAGGYAITSNYTGGTLSAFPVLEDGSLGEIAAQYIPEKEEGIVNHVHCCIPSPDGKYLFATDLGADVIYRFDIGDKPFDNAEVALRFDRDLHPGPRHITFSKDGRFLYVIHELQDLISVISYDNGNLSLLSSIKAYDGEGHGSADIHLSPDGRFLYASHRLREDGISIFRVNAEDGSLESAGYTRTGVHPRNFAITPDGNILLCACRDSDKIELYKRNPETGLLSGPVGEIRLPSPVCISIVNVRNDL